MRASGQAEMLSRVVVVLVCIRGLDVLAAVAEIERFSSRVARIQTLPLNCRYWEKAPGSMERMYEP